MLSPMPSARKTEPKTDRWLSLSEAARQLGTTRHTVLARALRGELETQQVAGRTVVSRESVEQALAAA